jgi:hypothetical protein
MTMKRGRSKLRKTKIERRARPPFPGRLLVVGGQRRKVGKSALVVDLIKAFPKHKWTAIKITPYTEYGCPVKGTNCGCGPSEHTFSIQIEKSKGRRTDTSRFLAAGAQKAIWVETKRGQVKDALAHLALALGDAENVIAESNTIVSHWRPDLFLLVLNPSKGDFKTSAQAVMRVADAFVFRSPFSGDAHPKGGKIPKSGRPRFVQALGSGLPNNLREFVRQRFLEMDHHRAEQMRHIFS